MRRLILLLAGAVLLVAFVPAVAAARPPANAPVTAPVTGNIVGDPGSTVEGMFTIARFATSNGQIVAIGSFTGDITDSAGNVTSGTQALTLPLADAVCEILDLTLGPLDLNLLGLVVHLDTVHLDIDAQPGPGNLLGNLLCAIAGLLDGPSPLTPIVNLLNQLLALLRLFG